MSTQHSLLERTWPPQRIRVRSERLELRLPVEAEVLEIVDRASRPGAVHDPDDMPFAGPWTDGEPAMIRQRGYQWHAQQRANWEPDRWTLLLAAFVDGEPVGAQDIGATDFRLRREVGSGSWLLRSMQGGGLGTEMRELMLHLAFEGLGALAANSSAYLDNPASQRVSAKSGYAPNGVAAVVRSRGAHAPGGELQERAMEQLFRIERGAWMPRRRDDIELAGLDDEVLAMFGRDRTETPRMRRPRLRPGRAASGIGRFRTAVVAVRMDGDRAPHGRGALQHDKERLPCASMQPPPPTRSIPASSPPSSVSSRST
ncbi:MAG: GCN5-related N-acetyltransferase [Thermoleophilia bacterium]|nr:GCN5-related N-acetyltransferase [Thermoleophilia bacterium]